ncbi:hypothetical protein PT015_02430 [Candidatus Mycobacterium wuenschmannii]|uniref:Uncharacterized protein n=1 Tax=Candidatus Mycobacterium wuenschmannii TaxID=3027808 RepID=A0ABY8VXM7_9MYCO|nr:hypothetical protein [Candidatus Mycobacterium wuenschmannii]WIM88383.1 hypothetical protein PT015_02430 [Candidatus Mycobacterium wuenschmannii]
MTSRGIDDDGTIDDLPWASVFDPAANARALSAIQAEGFRAASRIVDRFVRAVEPKANEGPPDDDGASAGDGVHEFERLTRAWWSMAGQFLLRSLPATTKSGSASVSLDVSDSHPQRGVNVDAALGKSASAEIWLHNRGPEDRGDVRLHVSDLLSHDGNVISAAAVRLDAEIVAMPARSSRGIELTVEVAPDARPGVYRGTLLASGNPDLWLPVTLTVRLPST